MLSMRLFVVAIAAAFLCSVAGAAQAAEAPAKLWERHPGSNAGDSVWAVATDAAGAVAVAGNTMGSIGKANAGGEDVFVIKYAPAGAVLWRRQLGTRNIDRTMGVATDADRNITVVGYTTGWLFGRNAGGCDGFVVSYTPDGAVRWKHQLATASDDFALAVANDETGNVLVAGNQASSGLLIKYRPDGTEVWRRLFGASYTLGYGVAVAPSGNIVVAGLTDDSLGGPNQGQADAFFAAYSPTGALQWTRQFGTANDEWVRSVAIAADGKIYLVGTENSGPPDYVTRPFLAAFSPAGVARWKRTFGGEVLDEGIGVAVDAAGTVVVTGQKFRQQFAASYTPGGTLLWTMNLATQSDYQLFPAFDTAGHLFLAGSINTLPPRGYSDGYLAKFAE